MAYEQLEQEKLDKAQEYWNNNELEKTEATLKLVLESNPNHADASLFLAYLYSNNGQYEQAKEICLRFLFSKDMSIRAAFLLGRIAFAEKKEAEAHHFFALCLEQNPNIPLALAWYARTASSANEKTAHALKEAERLANNDVETLATLYYAYDRQNQDSNEQRRISKKLEQIVSDERYLLSLNMLNAQKDKNEKESIAILYKYLQRNPDDEMAQNWLASFLKKGEDQKSRYKKPNKIVSLFFIAIILLNIIIFLLSKR